MADLLGSVFGGGQRTNQDQKPDAIGQAMNREKLNQVQALFNQVGLENFAGPSGAYTPSDDVLGLQGFARGNMRETNDPRNMFNLANYQEQGESGLSRGYQTASEANRLGYTTARQGSQAGRGVAISSQNEALNRSRASLGDTFERGRAVNRAGLGTARSSLTSAYDTGRAANRGALDSGRAINRGGYDAARTTARTAYDTGRGVLRGAKDEGLSQAARSGQAALGVSDRAFERGRREALDQTSGYIAQVADPISKQNAVLQGLEGGGMVPASIARATAEYGGNLLGPLLAQYMSGQQGIAGQQQATEGALGQQFAGSEASLLSQLLGGEQVLGGQYMSGEQALSDRFAAGEQGLAGQYLGAESALGSQFMGGEQALGNQVLSGDQALLSQFMQALGNIDQTAMGAEAGFGQAYMGAQAGAGNTYANNLANFSQSMPGAAEVLGTMPGKMNALNAQTATSMLPLFDYSRQLQEQDLLRRQGLTQTAFTGIPFNPGGSTNQRQSTQPLFNFFGQG